MGPPRTLLLFDDTAQPPSWNERMMAGEYAVHYSSFDSAPGTPPNCTVFSSLEEAEAYAKEQVAQRPDLQCRIYDHQGFVGEPIREFSGSAYKRESFFSPRFRRWVGSGLFFGGLALIILDWSHDFLLTWPATIGTRMFIPGLILLVTEAIIVLSGRLRQSRSGRKVL